MRLRAAVKKEAANQRERAEQMAHAAVAENNRAKQLHAQLEGMKSSYQADVKAWKRQRLQYMGLAALSMAVALAAIFVR